MAIKIGRKMIGQTAAEQLGLERKRFASRMRPKPVIAERIKSREERELSKKKSGNKKQFIEEL